MVFDAQEEYVGIKMLESRRNEKIVMILFTCFVLLDRNKQKEPELLRHGVKKQGVYSI